MIKPLLFFFTVLYISIIYSQSSTNTIITNLPGLSSPPSFNQYSGYINVSSSAGEKSLFYWFVESQDNPESDPVVLWMQGGPGCSSLIGFFQENGPFLIDSDGKTLNYNPFSWNLHANVIYLEQPAGVGFSYASQSQGYNTGDNETALNNYEFLENFFVEYPQFSSNDFWITGESYGGVYVPSLAYQIETGSNLQLKSNLKGLAIGNPVIFCSSWKDDFLTEQLELFYFHGLVSFNNRKLWYIKGCDISLSESCIKLYNSIRDSIGPFDIDNLYFDFCTGNGTLNMLDSVPNCLNIDARTPFYLNIPEVQQTIHAKSTVWNACTHRPSLNYTESFQNMLNYYNYFFDNNNINILIYSGDVDIADVPHIFTQKCLSELNRPIISSWKRWTIPGPLIPNIPLTDSNAKQNVTAGYVEVYDKYTYCTIRGAGHEAPQFQPLLAYNMLNRFISNGHL